MPIAVPSTSGSGGQQHYLAARRADHKLHLGTTLALQAEVTDDVDRLIAQEGYDVAAQKGLREWVGDTGVVWRALRRHRYDPAKAHDALLSTLSERVALSLHLPVPACPSLLDSSSSSLSTENGVPPFAVLPLPTFHTLTGQPVALITLRAVLRDSNGSLDPLKEWVWWALELTRRAVRDWNASQDGRRDAGDEAGTLGMEEEGEDATGGRAGRAWATGGCVLMIDAAGAGYRNLEIELLPTLLSVGHAHFPGTFDAALVVNSGWAQRSMWGIVRRVMPRSAVDKIRFLDSDAAVGEWFDPERLPRGLGGTVDYTLSSSSDTIAHLYSTRASYQPAPALLDPSFPLQSHRHKSTSTLARDSPSSYEGSRPSIPDYPAAPAATAAPTAAAQAASRSASYSSLSDLFYTAPASPLVSAHTSRAHSRGQSRRGSLAPVSATASATVSASSAALAKSLHALSMTRKHSAVDDVGADTDADAHAAAAAAADIRAGRGKDDDGEGKGQTGAYKSPAMGNSVHADIDAVGEGRLKRSYAAKRAVGQGALPTNRTGPPSRGEANGGQLSPVMAHSSFAPEQAHDHLLPAKSKPADLPSAGVQSDGMGDRYAEGRGDRLTRSTATRPIRPLRPARDQAQASPSTSMSPMQRIKSLSDFHLYLSPSRLAHIDLLSDSDSETELESESKSGTRSGLGTGSDRYEAAAVAEAGADDGDVDVDIARAEKGVEGAVNVNGSALNRGGFTACPGPRSVRTISRDRDRTLRSAGVSRAPHPILRPSNSLGYGIDPASSSHTQTSTSTSAPTSAATATPMPAPTRKTLRPLMLDPAQTDRLHATLSSSIASIASRRLPGRPPLRIHGVESELRATGNGNGNGNGDGDGDCARTYSGRMGLHHVAALRTYQRSPSRLPLPEGSGAPSSEQGEGVKDGANQLGVEAGRREVGGDEVERAAHPDLAIRSLSVEEPCTYLAGPDGAQSAPGPPSLSPSTSPTSPPSATSPASALCTDTHAPTPNPEPARSTHISPFSRSLNPWFGYPALLTHTASGEISIAPRHARRRNRDLIKTLLFLAMLRLQNIRDTLERALGLRALGGEPWVRWSGRYLDSNGVRDRYGTGSAFGAGAGVGATTGTSTGDRTGVSAPVPVPRGYGHVVHKDDPGADTKRKAVGPAEGLWRVQEEQRRRLLLAAPAASGDGSLMRTETALRHRTTPALAPARVSGSGASASASASASANRPTAIAALDVLRLLQGWWAPSYSAELIWALVGVVLFRGAWVRALQRLMAILSFYRVVRTLRTLRIRVPWIGRA